MTEPTAGIGEPLIDFDRVRACTDLKIFITATNVWTGKVAVFNGPDLTADHLMASACLPSVFQAVEIDGQPYWDGGYMGNPALFPIFYEAVSDDINDAGPAEDPAEPVEPAEDPLEPAVESAEPTGEAEDS